MNMVQSLYTYYKCIVHFVRMRVVQLTKYEIFAGLGQYDCLKMVNFIRKQVRVFCTECFALVQKLYEILCHFGLSVFLLL